MSEFAPLDLTDQAPAGICRECAAGALHHEPTGTDLAHCAHTLTGAYRALGREWQVVRGVELHAFREAVVRAVFQVELRADLERDLRELMQREPGTRH